MLFANFCDKFLEYQENDARNSPGEMNQKRMCVKNHLLPEFGAMALDAINESAINRYAANKRKLNYAPATINNHLAVLGRLLRYAEKQKNLEAMPEIRRERSAPLDDKNFLTDEQAQALIMAADRHRNPMWRLAMMLVLNTGIRVGELLALQWDSIDRAAARVTIKSSFCRQSRQIKCTKSGKVRYLPLNQTALQALDGLRALQRDGDPRVVPGDYETAHKAMTVTAHRADIGRCTWHTLRHTFASNLVLRNVPLHSVSKLLGHSSIAMTERYSHLHNDQAKKIMAMLDA